MDQFKFSLGPFEFFASIIGGIPLCLAGYFLYSPIDSLKPEWMIFQEGNLVAIAFVALGVSYVISSTLQGFTWQYFRRLSKLFNCNYRYFLGSFIREKQRQLQAMAQPIALDALSFEARLVFLLQKHIGIPEKMHWMDARVTAYMREHNKQAVLNRAERHLAVHIMHRTWSFGFCVLGFVLLLNPFRLAHHSLELWLLPFVAWLFAYFSFAMALSFKRWHNQVLLLGFYFAAMNQDEGTTTR
ncbi:MAG: hypothetical protein AB8B99_00945 [Phormidesmis sp.]